MALTPAQQTMLRTAVQADATLNALPQTSDGADAIAAYYNQLDPGPYKVWNPATPLERIREAISWTNFTPNDDPSETLVYIGRAEVCSIKQRNLQLILGDAGPLNATLANTRAGLQDCLTGIPSGAAGAKRNAGWPAAGGSGVHLACQRAGTRAEKLFGVGPGGGAGTSASPADAAYLGELSYQDVLAAMGW